MNARKFSLIAVMVATVGVAGVGFVRAQLVPKLEDSPFLRLDPTKIMMDSRDSRVPCGECHKAEYEKWLTTKHADGFNTMHRSDMAQDILRDMGLQTTKRQESLCLRCHYTVKSPELTAFAGVSCEGCHGAARDWVKVHNDLGPDVKKPEQETPAHRQARITKSEAGGMLRPSGNLYSVAANCFECHTVPIEELVNKGGHPAGSSGFELTDRIGDIRHNFLAQQFGGGAENRAPTAERTRVTFVAGSILDYEYSIRGMAKATKADRFSKTMERRIAKAKSGLESVGQTAEIAEVRDILAAGSKVRFTIGNSAALMTLADRIRTLGQRFTSTHDGSKLAALDGLIAGTATAPEAEVPPPPGAAATPVGATPPASATASTPTKTAPAAGGAAIAPRGATAGAPAAPSAAPPSDPSIPQPGPTVSGAVHTTPPWFPKADSKYKTTQEAEECSSCHAVAEDWWLNDKHQKSGFPLLNRDPKALDIARLYGLSANEITMGNKICMNCHGTIKTAAPNVPVRMGVSCESCHGPSSAYLEPHQDGGNPQLGMVSLKSASARAANCSRCHRISDERLLASGHPSGSDYNFATANTKIKHWPDDRRVGRARAKRGEPAYAEIGAAALTSAYQSTVATRPIPNVTVAADARPSSPASRSTAAPRTAPRAAPSVEAAEVRSEPRSPNSTTGGEPVAPPPRPPTPRPASRATSNVVLPPVRLEPDAVAPDSASPDSVVTRVKAPEVNAETTTEDILLIIKRRLEQLYKALGRGS